MKRILLASGMIILGLFSAILWWPTAISGRVLHGETDEPVSRVEVYLRSDVYKPWFILSALAYADVTSSERSQARTDRDGVFSKWVFAGLRLDDVTIDFRKRGYVVQPNLHSMYGGALSSDRERDLSAKSAGEIVFADVHAWPAAQQVETGDRRPELSLDGSEKRLRIGKRKRLLILQLDRADDSGSVTITARYHKGEIRTANSRDPLSLIAPLDGYLAQARAVPVCEGETAVIFFLRDEANQYGWVSIDPWPICQQRERMRVEYRLGTRPGIRSLVGEVEVSW